MSMKAGVFLAALALLGCERAVCPQSEWCEGDTRVRCDLDCSGGGTGKGGGLPTSCTKKLTQLDCAQYGRDTFGVEKTCQRLELKDDVVFDCVDKPATPCAITQVGTAGVVTQSTGCGPRDSLVTCHGTAAQAFVNTTTCFDPTQACTPTATGVTCVDAPKVSCQPELFPRCAGGAVQRCAGSVDAGFFVVTTTCGTSPSFVITCVEADGGAACVSSPRDGGP
jgi:hypothetical protein